MAVSPSKRLTEKLERYLPDVELIGNVAPVQRSRVLGEKVWCPSCGEYVKVVRVTSAAKIVDVDRRTVYNYIKTKKVFAIKVAGSTLRVCSSCLLRENDASHVEDCTTAATTATEIREVARR